MLVRPEDIEVRQYQLVLVANLSQLGRALHPDRNQEMRREGSLPVLAQWHGYRCKWTVFRSVGGVEIAREFELTAADFERHESHVSHEAPQQREMELCSAVSHEAPQQREMELCSALSHEAPQQREMELCSAVSPGRLGQPPVSAPAPAVPAHSPAHSPTHSPALPRPEGRRTAGRRSEGKLISFDPAKGFGFLSREGEDLFFHTDDVATPPADGSYARGRVAWYRLGVQERPGGHQGRPKAVDVEFM